MENGFEVLPAVENTFNEHCIGGHDECNRDAPLARRPGSKSSRRCPRRGNVVRPAQKATMRAM
jgi:hypothetical protein